MANNGKQVLVELTSQQVEELAHSLRQTSSRAAKIEEATTRLVEGGASQAAAAEQTRTSLEGVVTSMEETSTVAEQMARSLGSVAGNARDVSTGLDTIASGLAEITASVTGVGKDSSAL